MAQNRARLWRHVPRNSQKPQPPFGQLSPAETARFQKLPAYRIANRSPPDAPGTGDEVKKAPPAEVAQQKEPFALPELMEVARGESPLMSGNVPARGTTSGGTSARGKCHGGEASAQGRCGLLSTEEANWNGLDRATRRAQNANSSGVDRTQSSACMHTYTQLRASGVSFAPRRLERSANRALFRGASAISRQMTAKRDARPATSRKPANESRNPHRTIGRF